VQQADATKLSGRSATAVSVPNSSKADSVCGFNAHTHPEPNAIDDVIYSLLAYVYDGTDQYAPARATGAKNVTGVGDRAFTTVRDDLLTLAFVKNGETVLLAYSITGFADHPKSSASAASLIALGKQAASRM